MLSPSYPSLWKYNLGAIDRDSLNRVQEWFPQETPETSFQRGRADKVIKELATNGRVGSIDMRGEPSAKTGITNLIAKKRAGRVVLYSMATVFLAAFCSFVFNALGHDTEFAIAVMGSLIGGFLGAMLAAALIVDIYLPKPVRDQEYSAGEDPVGLIFTSIDKAGER